MPSRHWYNRRDFLKTSATTTAGLMLASAGEGFAMADPEKPVRIGLIGAGRGAGLMADALRIVPGLQVKAVCDINAAAAKGAAGIITKRGLAEPNLFTDGDMAWEKMLQAGGLDAVIIATPWNWHTPMAVEAMKQGIIPGMEVNCSQSLEECWQLVDTSEKTGIPCMMLENWSFRGDNLALLNMVRAGLFGKIVHVHCAHSHDCRSWYFDKQWPVEYLVKYNRDLYPTHSLGPVLSWCDINCGDRFTTISSVATNSLGINEWCAKRFGPDHPNTNRVYAQGDIVTSILRTEKGKTVVVNNDMQLPRPYDNRWMLQGTRGVYSEERNGIYLEGETKTTSWEAVRPYLNRYWHRWWLKGSEGPHGGADCMMLRCFFEAVRNRQPLPLDVYDSVTMSAVVDLSGQSIAKGGNRLLSRISRAANGRPPHRSSPWRKAEHGNDAAPALAGFIEQPTAGPRADRLSRSRGSNGPVASRPRLRRQ